MSHTAVVLDQLHETKWINQAVTAVVDDGPAASLRIGDSPAEMAKLMLANNQDKSPQQISSYLQYLLNHSTYRMSPEFRGKIQAAKRIIDGGMA